MSAAASDLPYRPCAGIIIRNRTGEIFVGQRIDSVAEAWQLPQGGIDEGEDAQDAALRELGEETGIAAEKVRLLAIAPGEYRYDLPDELIGKVWKGKWRGQRMRWFLYQFLGEDADINIATAHPEFRAWRWVSTEAAIALAVPFKRDLYRAVFASLAEHLGPAGAQ